MIHKQVFTLLLSFAFLFTSITATAQDDKNKEVKLKDKKEYNTKDRKEKYKEKNKSDKWAKKDRDDKWDKRDKDDKDKKDKDDKWDKRDKDDKDKKDRDDKWDKKDKDDKDDKDENDKDDKWENDDKDGRDRRGGVLGRVILPRNGTTGPRQLSGVPKGHYPPPGSCRIWYPNRPAGQQPPPASCNSLVGVRLEPGAFILHGDKAYDSEYDWRQEERKRPGSVGRDILDIFFPQRQ